MAADDQKIKVIFEKVAVINDSDPLGDGEFYFIASVAGNSVGNRNRIFNAKKGQDIPLGWEIEVDVKNRASVRIQFKGMEEDIFFDDDLGTFTHTLRRPYSQGHTSLSNRFFELTFRVELLALGSFTSHPPNTVFACRQVAGSVSCTTVNGTAIQSRMEIHPVLPEPTSPPANAVPRRPAGLSGPVNSNPIVAPGSTIPTATSPINAFANPAVIPVLGPPDSAPPGAHSSAQLDAANWVNPRNCARIEYTRYWPGTLAFGDDDDRLTWSAVSLAGGGAVSFYKTDGTSSATDTGKKVRIYGTSAGEIRLEVRFKGAIFATYRALVLNIKQVPCRCNILNGPTAGTQPRVTPQDVQNHIDLANRSLRQLGLQLTMDTNVTPRSRHNAQAVTGFPGIFRIKVPRARTWQVRNTGWATRRNYRNNVMNFAYIHSDWTGRNPITSRPNPSNLGAAFDYPASNAGASITDPPTGAVTNATPSSSWARPTGVGVGVDATTTGTTMNLLTARQRTNRAGALSDPNLFAMYVCDSNGGPPGGNHRTANRQLTFANTIAHEFGHILNLGHRVEGVTATGSDMVAATPVASLTAGGIFWDGLVHPPRQNVMHWIAPSTIAQDFDLIQARAVHQSPLVVAAPLMAAAVLSP